MIELGGGRGEEGGAGREGREKKEEGKRGEEGSQEEQGKRCGKGQKVINNVSASDRYFFHKLYGEFEVIFF